MSKILEMEMVRMDRHVHSFVVKSARRMLLEEYWRLRHPHLRNIPKSVKGQDRQKLLDQRSGVSRDDFSLDGNSEGITLDDVLAAISIVSSGPEECQRRVNEWQEEGFASYVPTRRSKKSLPAPADGIEIVLEELRKRKSPSLVDVSEFQL